MLRIDPLTPEAGWRAHWSAEGRPVGAGFAVAGPAAESLAGVNQRFLALFEGEIRPLVDPEGLRALGAELHRLWWEPVSREIAAALSPGGNGLVIASADRRVLNLPWELIERLPGLPLGCDAAWSVRRLPVVDGTSAAAEPPLSAGPLRILFLAAAPIDQPQLDYEREEDA